MALPIKREKLPPKIPIKELAEIARKSAGGYNKPPSKSEFTKAFKGTRLTNQPYGHFTKQEAEKFLKEVDEKFGFTSIAGRRGLKQKVKEFQEQPEKIKPTVSKTTPKKSSGGFLARMFGKQRTAPSDQFSQMADQRRSRQAEFLESQLRPQNTPDNPSAATSIGHAQGNSSRQEIPLQPMSEGIKKLTQRPPAPKK